MQTRLPSASKVGRAFRCIASAVYQQTDRVRPSGERGTAVHKFLLVDVPRVGRDKALNLAPPEWRASCEAINLDGLPLDPSAYAAEVSFAWDHTAPDETSGREVGRNIGREYGYVSDSEFIGTADLVGLLKHGGVYVLDVKTGRTPPDEEQLMTLALAACRAYKRKWALCEFIFIPEAGEPYHRRWDMDEIEIDAFADRLRHLAGDIAKAREKFALESVEPRATIGDHCRFCSSLAHCRPSQQLVRTFVVGPLGIEEQLRTLTPEDKGKAWLVVKQGKLLLEEAERVLRLEAEISPLPLPDGSLVQIVQKSRREFDADLVYRAVAKDYGDAVAEVAAPLVPATRTMTLKTVDAALKSTGRGYTKRAEALLDGVEAEGGCRVSTWPEAKIVRPELPAKKEGT